MKSKFLGQTARPAMMLGNTEHSERPAVSSKHIRTSFKFMVVCDAHEPAGTAFVRGPNGVSDFDE
jgi:hypothetical protein